MLVQNPNQTENYKPQTNLVNNIFIYKELNLKKKRYVKFYLFKHNNITNFIIFKIQKSIKMLYVYKKNSYTLINFIIIYCKTLI